jgi:hypothetical protein
MSSWHTKASELPHQKAVMLNRERAGAIGFPVPASLFLVAKFFTVIAFAVIYYFQKGNHEQKTVAATFYLQLGTVDDGQWPDFIWLSHFYFLQPGRLLPDG